MNCQVAIFFPQNMVQHITYQGDGDGQIWLLYGGQEHLPSVIENPKSILTHLPSSIAFKSYKYSSLESPLIEKRVSSSYSSMIT